MNSLTKLIERITYPHKVSREDVFDDIKQYWTDVSQDYWPKVDEDLADELGVTPTALSELLEVNRHTFDYANLGGNSSVRGYDHGEDWFVVMFSDGSRYLYTLKSTSRESLDTMRKYATEGKGLNSYIMRLVKTNYAGRNVKGEILIKPGMESYANEGYRRLKLIEAFRNSMTTPTASNEGMIESVKKFLGMSNKGNIPTIYAFPSTVSKLRDDLKLNFGNPGWLDKQTYVTGPINGKGITDVLNINGKVDIDAALKATEVFATKENQYIKELDQYRSKVKPALDLLIKNNKQLTQEVYEQALEITQKAKKFFKSTVKWPDQTLTGKGTYSGPNQVKAKYQPVELEIQALDEATVKKTMSAVMASLDKIASQAFTIPDLPTSLDKMVYDLDGKAEPVGGISWAKWHDLIFACLGPGITDPSQSMNYTRAKNSYMDVMMACARWIDRSIKGKVSVESISEGKEIHKSNTLKKYSAQLEQAGTDGLTPTARKIMAVGLKSMGAKFDDTVSTESLVGEVIPTNIALKDACQSALNVSNEGIWGAIKYLFGGNYENLPKINAAYDEAVDAVKSTYGNPSWVGKRRLNTGKNVKVKSFSEVARNPRAAFDKVKQHNQKALDTNKQIFKEELEYVGKFTKFLTGPERTDQTKAQALLDMFDKREYNFVEVDELNLGSSGDVSALDAQGINEAATVFEDASKYRLETDQVFSSGLYKTAYTDSGKERWGRQGTETAKLEGAAQKLAVQVGDTLIALQEAYYPVSMSAWENVNNVVKGCLYIMEASAK